MSKKRIGYIATVLIILAAVTAALCVFLTLRSRNNDEGQEGTEQESAVLPEESDLELPPEIETVSVETDDAVSELYRALELALTDAEDCMEDVVTSLTRSAELGNSDAMYFLGEIYFQGIGVEADLEKAGACLRQACDSGNRKAMPLYAKMLFMGFIFLHIVGGGRRSFVYPGHHVKSWDGCSTQRRTGKEIHRSGGGGWIQGCGVLPREDSGCRQND